MFHFVFEIFHNCSDPRGWKSVFGDSNQIFRTFCVLSTSSRSSALCILFITFFKEILKWLIHVSGKLSERTRILWIICKLSSWCLYCKSSNKTIDILRNHVYYPLNNQCQHIILLYIFFLCIKLFMFEENSNHI